MSIVDSTHFGVISVKNCDDEPPQIHLYHIASKKILETTGALLEAQYSIDGQYLLFITEDAPFAETLHILLIDPDTNVIDSIELFAPYTPGTLRNIVVVQPNKVIFSFFDKTETWHLEVLQKPYIQLWANEFPIKRSSPLLHKTWLTLQKK
ncbi:MAG: hypothetical protein LBV45_07340 [Xanthomonadaceae bacterium]|jgi:hypothetical protein|nr:hypothetical protein [Xanthomonadaceae bacterium]